jgi:hypothetical protein
VSWKLGNNIIKISKRLAPSENLMVVRTYVGLGKTLKRMSISDLESLGLYEQKHHKPWFGEDCLQFLD